MTPTGLEANSPRHRVDRGARIVMQRDCGFIDDEYRRRDTVAFE